jgi:hypothetical protein
MEQTECSKTSAYKIQTLGNYPEENIQHTEHGESLKSRIFWYINPNNMHMLQSLFHLTTALHVSDITIAHLQEHKTTVTTASGNRYTVLLSAAIVELV